MASVMVDMKRATVLAGHVCQHAAPALSFAFVPALSAAALTDGLGLRISTSERFAGVSETCRARVVTLPTTRLEGAEWERPSPAPSSFQMVAEEPRMMLGDGTSRSVAAGTLPVVCEGGACVSVKHYTEEL